MKPKDLDKSNLLSYSFLTDSEKAHKNYNN